MVFQTSVFLRTLCVFRDQLILFGVYCCAFVDFFSQYCCPVNFKTAEKSTPKPFSIGLRAFFFKKSKPPENQIMMVGFAARGQDKKRMDLHEVPYPKKASAPFLWKKNRPLLLLLSLQTQIPTNPKGRVAVVQMSPDWEGQRLWSLFW